MTVRAETPPLRFRLMGSWHPVLLNQLDSTALVSEFVAPVIGRRDIDATIRAPHAWGPDDRHHAGARA